MALSGTLVPRVITGDSSPAGTQRECVIVKCEIAREDAAREVTSMDSTNGRSQGQRGGDESF